ncbi:MAG: dTDP-4-dehydrorhamnose 3,5-epimerase family protein [Actinomycetota bacterium]|nr:dTDP-4-dehydrorhamnose 3,5-epimerase family protein [Actinomycetota bacterium]
MRARRLLIDGAVEFTTPRFADDRGFFTSPLQEADLRAATGRPAFGIRQVSYNYSRVAGVLRGLHYTATPPGAAKYVFCPVGRIIDFLVDLRVGSPTFGVCDSVELNADNGRAVYLPVGIGHGSVVLTDHSMVVYLLSEEYVPANELAVHALDPALDLPIPDGLELLMSDRDRIAPALAEARAARLLPDYETCLALDEAMAQAGSAA